MIKSQLEAVFRKPAVRLKFFIITLLFIPALIEQTGNVIGFAGQFGGEGQATVAVILLETFNYLYFYVDILIVGYILLIPDIVRNEYIEKKSLMHCLSRKKAAVAAILRIIVFSVLYMAWFVFLTLLISGVWIRNFSLEWPRFIGVMIKRMSSEGQMMSLIMLPEGCLDYSVLVVLILVLLRSMLGFIFLGMLASMVTLLTKKTKYGAGVIVFLLAVTLFIYYEFGGGNIPYYGYDPSMPLVRSVFDVIKITIVPFFTFRSITDDFTYWIRYGILSGLVLSIIAGIGVWIYYQKGDLGDADQDE